MKKTTFIIILCLGLFAPLMAQNIWKTIGMEGQFLGVSASGDIFCNWGYSGVYRSSDEGASWDSIYHLSYVTPALFMINDLDRIFIFNENSHKLCYSDDNGDTWLEQTSGISTNWVDGMFSVSNDTIVMANHDKVFWTLDGGDSWNETSIDFIGDAMFGSIIADHAGNVYVSTYSWYYPVEQVGIYTATLDDMSNWTVKSPGGARDMAFDSQGNILATNLGSAYFANGVYYVDADRFALTDDDVIFAMKRVDYDNEALFYSTDYGQTYHRCSENIPSTLVAPDPDLGLYKGRDNHLYCHTEVWEPEFESRYYKSIRTTDEILDQYPHPQPDHYWPEVVTSQPEGYGVDTNGDVHIHSSEGLAWLISTVNGLNGQEADNFNGKTVTLEANVDMSAAIWTTIAQGINYGDPNPDRLTFRGTFDGNGFEIIGLYLYYPTMDMFDGFFGHLCGATIKNVTVRHAYATGRSTRDGLFFANADAETVIDRCLFEVDEVYKSDFNEDYAVFGYRNEGIITNCMTKIKKVDYQGNLGINMDMFVLWNEGTIQNCASVADSVKWLYSYAGIAGTNDGLIENCYSFIGTFFGDYEIWWPPAPRQGMCFYNHGTIRNGYYNTLAPEYYITNDAAYVNDGTIEQTSPFDWNEGWLLTDSIMETNDLFEALNLWTNTQGNISDYLQWCEDYTVLPNGLPVLYEEEQYFPRGTEWYYEIKHLNGDITYQHLEYASDTVVNKKRTKILVETNTMYDKEQWIDYEYIYEDGDKIYWWNKDLEDFTLLYDFGAEVGDEWEVNGGWFTITVHVDDVQTVTYNGKTYKMLSVSDVSHLFTGDILCGVGHMDHFFPESPIAKDYEVDGLRCFWQDGELVLNMGDEDCDAVYYEIHSVEENSEVTFKVYPNPTDGLLHIVETQCIASLPSEYRITNLLGQTLLSGVLDGEIIDVSVLSNGIYFLKINDSFIKIIVN